MAYLLPWAGKTVLFSGRIPIRVKDETWAELSTDLSKSREAAADYLISVNRLADAKPDVWLPAVATDGRNANLYDERMARHHRQAIIAQAKLPWSRHP